MKLVHWSLTLLAALTGIGAAILWYLASKQPVATSGPAPYMSRDLKDPLWTQIREQGEKVKKGARLNRWAAALTVIAAVLAFLAFMFDVTGPPGAAP